MRTYDLTPFYRSTVGFDRFFSLLDQATGDGSPGYPPYNIERTGENAYRISVAVSGFSQGELSIVAKENTLTIKGEKIANENGSEKSEVLYRGIAARAFERIFQLADFVQEKNASLENGLLHVDLVREIPEAKTPRNIPIAASEKAPLGVDGSAGFACAAADCCGGSTDLAGAGSASAGLASGLAFGTGTVWLATYGTEAGVRGEPLTWVTCGGIPARP